MKYNKLMHEMASICNDVFTPPKVRQTFEDAKHLIDDLKRELEIATTPKEESDVIIDRLLQDLKRSKEREVYRGKLLLQEINKTTKNER